MVIALSIQSFWKIWSLMPSNEGIWQAGSRCSRENVRLAKKSLMWAGAWSHAFRSIRKMIQDSSSVTTLHPNLYRLPSRTTSPGVGFPLSEAWNIDKCSSCMSYIKIKCFCEEEVWSSSYQLPYPSECSLDPFFWISFEWEKGGGSEVTKCLRWNEGGKRRARDL